MNKIYGLRNSQTGELMFSYRTNQGNVKKAFFSSEKLANKTIKDYLTGDKSPYHPNIEATKFTWEVVEIDFMWNKDE